VKRSLFFILSSDIIFLLFNIDKTFEYKYLRKKNFKFFSCSISYIENLIVFFFSSNMNVTNYLPFKLHCCCIFLCMCEHTHTHTYTGKQAASLSSSSFPTLSFSFHITVCLSLRRQTKTNTYTAALYLKKAARETCTSCLCVFFYTPLPD
jgi:hypothetical protein